MQNKKTMDELQEEVKESVIEWLRTKLSNDAYDGKIQAAVVLSNKTTGKITTVSCNANTTGETKKLLNEALDLLKRAQTVNAILGAIRMEGADGKHSQTSPE